MPRILRTRSTTEDSTTVFICDLPHARKVVWRHNSLPIHTSPYSRIQCMFGSLDQAGGQVKVQVVFFICRYV